MSALRFDHFVVCVPSVAAAMQQCQAAGWPVRYGGQHGDSPTENAIIPLRGEGYIELLGFKPAWLRWLLQPLPLAAFTRNRLPHCKRNLLLAMLNQRGLATFAFSTGNIASLVGELRLAGWQWDDPVTMQRQDGERDLSWSLSASERAALPFLIEDHSDRSLRRGVAEGVASVVDIELPRSAALDASAAMMADMSDVALRCHADSARGLTATLRLDAGVSLPDLFQPGFRV